MNYVDSSGIGELIANYTTVSRQGGQLKLLNLTDQNSEPPGDHQAAYRLRCLRR